jgi:large repetitive protein
MMRIISRSVALAALAAGAVWAQELTITTTSPLPTATVGAPYPALTFGATGGSGMGYTWSASGNLPAGLALSTAGEVTGMPASTAVTSTFTVQVTDSASNTASGSFTLPVALAITTTTIPSGAVNATYPSTTLLAQGGAPPYSDWAVSSGSLPAGMTLSSSGVLGGAPTTAAGSPFLFSVTVQDSAGNTSPPQTLSLTVNAALVVTTTSPLPTGTMGVAYPQQTLAASGGAGGFTNWTVVSGALPGGLSLTASSGKIGGTPSTTTGSPFSFSVTVQDSAGNTSPPSQTLVIAIDPALVITSTSPLPTGTVNVDYSQTLKAAGGSGAYTWAVSTGSSLPTGLSLSPAGLISGAPSAAGQASFMVQVTDSNQATATQTFALTINPALVITTAATLPAGTVNVSYSVTLKATGGSGTYTWAVSLGSLPSGLSLSAAGLISGPPATAGQANFTIKVTDGNQVTATQAFTLTLNPALVVTTAASLPIGTVNVNYAQTLAATGGSGQYTWSLVTGSSLPAGLSLNATMGTISGSPTAPGQASFTIQATDSNQATASKQFTMTIDPALVITTAPLLPAGTVGISYSQTLKATGGSGQYTWSVSVGSLPAGLALNSANGAISGQPGTAATSSFTIQVTDSDQFTASNTFALTIDPPPAITTSSPLAEGVLGVAYNQTLTGSGGATPYTWSLTIGSLPAGLALASTGVISGMPSAAGTFQFTIQLTDSTSPANTVAKQFAITVAAGLTVTTASLPNATVGVAYSQTLAAAGGAAPYTWSISGSLPAPLALNASNGQISGTPAAKGAATFTVTVTDSALNTAKQTLTLTVVAPPAITTASPLPGGEATVAYSQALAATGGTAPYTWSVTGGALPAGVTLAANGSLTGTPGAAGTFNFTVQAADSNNVTASAGLSVTIAGALAISTPAALSGGSLSSSYSQSLTATAGVTPYAWSLTSGLLPAGLNLSPAGAITGIPSTTGTFPFTAKVADALGATASRQFTIVIANGLSISTPATLPVATLGITYSNLLQASGGVAPYTWSDVAGSPPAGLSISSNGNLTGIPTHAGTSSFTVEVTDSQGHMASEQLSLTVAASLSVTTNTLPAVTLGGAYSQSLIAAGGTPPYTWSLVTGPLPGGLTLSAGGSITGTASAAGTFPFTVKAVDSAGVSTTKQLSITVVAGLAITTAAGLPNASINASYAQTLAAAGGTPPYTWTLTAGSLPRGLTLSAAGAITGAPAATGTFQFTATVTDSASGTANQQFTLIVGGVVITTTTLPGGQVGVSYSELLTATGGTPPYSFAISAGSLPPGIALNGAELSGTPTTTGSYTFTIQATDSASANAKQQFTIAIGGLIITTSVVPSAAVGTPYSQTLSASGTAPFTWMVAHGGLPGGLSLNASSGTISGTPTVAGISSVTIQVTDSTNATATAAFTLTVISASFSGLSSTAAGAQQVSFTLVPGAAYPQEITGQVKLAFQPDASLASPADDPSIQFSTGGVTASFTIPANSTASVPFSLQTGTVAGSIALTVSWQAGGATLAAPAALTQAIQIAPAVPVITAVTASTSSSGFQVVVTGYSNTREVSQALLQFTPATGQTLQTTSLTVSLTSAAASWFESSTSDQYGGQFVLTLPFTVSNGSASAIGSVSVQLVNSQGASTSADATF